MIYLAFDKGVGGILIGSGLTASITDLASQRAAKELYAKEANLARKNDLYVPLYREVIELHDALDRAIKRSGPYPFCITVSDQNQPVIPQFNRTDSITFHLWGQFSSDERKGNFLPNTRVSLEGLMRQVNDYNVAIDKFKQAATNFVIEAIDRAVKQMIDSGFYETIQSKSHTCDAKKQEGRCEHDYFSRISDPSKVGVVWANWWLTDHLDVLGWLASGMTHEAALAIQKANGSTTMVPVDWIEGVLEDAWRSLGGSFTQIELIRVGRYTLLFATRAKEKLEAGLRFIQNTYEGGEPVV